MYLPYLGYQGSYIQIGGTDFTSNLFKEVCALFRVDKTLTTPWRLQSDGMVERMNRTLGPMLRAYTNEHQDDWDEYLPFCALAYNSSCHSSTSYSPNYLMFGRDFRVPLELVLPVPDEELSMRLNEDSVDHFVRKLQLALQTAYSVAREKLQASFEMQKHYYDRKVVPKQFKVGQAVWLYNPRRRKGRSPKLDIPWEGPFAVVKVFNQVLCLIQKSRRSKPKIVHVDKLCHTRQPVDTDWVFTLPKKTYEQVPGEIYEGLTKLFSESQIISQEDREEVAVSEPTIPQEVFEDSTLSRADSQPVQVDPLQKQTRSGKNYLLQ